jgi:hypothetical protein
LLAPQTLTGVIEYAARRDELLRALTPDSLKGGASPHATAATINSVPFPSGQNSAYNNLNGAFSETSSTPPTRVGLSQPRSSLTV